MRTGSTTQTVPESRVDFSSGEAVYLDGDPREPQAPEVLTGEVWYLVPVVVEVEDGEVTSVRVYDESVTLRGHQPDASPAVIAIANEQEDWPAWIIG